MLELHACCGVPKEMTARAWANVLWGFATLAYPSSSPNRTGMYAAAVSCNVEMSAQELSITAWSLGTLRAVGHLEALAGSISHFPQDQKLAISEVGHLVWGLSHVQLSPSTSGKLHEAIVSAIQGLTCHPHTTIDVRGLAMLARGLLRLRMDAAFRSLLDHALKAVAELTAEAFLNEREGRGTLRARWGNGVMFHPSGLGEHFASWGGGPPGWRA